MNVICNERAKIKRSRPSGISKRRYYPIYSLFKDWCKRNNFDTITERVMLHHFQQKSKTKKPSTLWLVFRMLKSALRDKENIDISRYKKVIKFLKENARTKSARTCTDLLSIQQIEKFINEADDFKFLMMKVALVIEISGNCNYVDLSKLTVNDIEDHHQGFIVVKLKNNERVFAIRNPLYINLYRKYVRLRPSCVNTDRFFLEYNNGRCGTQPVGVNKFETISSTVTKFLKLPNSVDYSTASPSFNHEYGHNTDKDSTDPDETMDLGFESHQLISPDAPEDEAVEFKMDISEPGIYNFNETDDAESFDIKNVDNNGDVDDKNNTLIFDINNSRDDTKSKKLDTNDDNSIKKRKFKDNIKLKISSNSSVEVFGSSPSNQINKSSEFEGALNSSGIYIKYCVNCTININFVKKF